MHMSNRSNRTLHYAVTLESGETFAEKCRDSLGGFNNLVTRLEERLGGRLRFTETDGAASATFTCGELTGSLEEVAK